MPQLDKVTFLPQFFWLCVIYLGFYFILLKYFLPKISRILALRKRKMSFSQEGMSSLQQENLQVVENYETVVSKGLSTSKNVFHNFFSHTTNWLDNRVLSLNKTHYQKLNHSYIQSLGETSLSQNLLLYYASRNLPETLTLKILAEKMKNLRSFSPNSKKVSGVHNLTDKKKSRKSAQKTK